jgi:hypothetical protein
VARSGTNFSPSNKRPFGLSVYLREQTSSLPSISNGELLPTHCIASHHLKHHDPLAQAFRRVFLNLESDHLWVTYLLRIPLAR